MCHTASGRGALLLLTRLLVRDTVDGFAPRVSVVRPLVATHPRAHLVMHVDVSHVLVQRAIDGLASWETIVGMPGAILPLARFAHGARLRCSG